MAHLKYHEIYELAKNYSATLTHADTHSKGVVIVVSVHGPPSVLVFHNAFVAEKDNEWYCVFTEYNGFHVFWKDDVRLTHYKESNYDFTSPF